MWTIAPPRRDHGGHQGPIEPNRGEKIALQLCLPVQISDDGKATCRRVRSSQGVHEDLHAASRRDPLGHRRRTGDRGEIGGDEMLRIRVIVGCGPCRGPHLGSAFAQLACDGGARTLGAGGHERSLASERLGKGGHAAPIIVD